MSERTVPRKRPASENMDNPKHQTDGDASASPLAPMFEQFRAELDEHQDRRERIIKANRDITASSKKIIFALHRAKHLGRPLEASIHKAMAPHLAAVKMSLAALALETAPPNDHRYARQLFGLQELVEAIAFEHYLTTQTLLSHDAAQWRIDALASTFGVPLSADDYVQGVLDATGELMRFAVTSMAGGTAPAGSGDDTSDGGDIAPRGVLEDLRALRLGLELLDAHAGCPGWWAGKMEVMRASCEKVEKGAYGLALRARVGEAG